MKSRELVGHIVFRGYMIQFNLKIQENETEK